jgi:redox-sensitive bicupin YhaK (pirin superfamily)
MIERRPFAALGQFRNDWLNARHHFSFGEYHDPARLGFGPLRVWNDDEIAPGRGFDPHPHREMEIITYVREGAISHRDSLGNEGRTAAGDVQVMHAGTGIVHAEYNREAGPTRLFQIWVMPNRARVAPGWGMRRFPREGGGLQVLASGRAAHEGVGALPLYADAAVLAGRLAAGERVEHALPAGGGAYLVAARGTVAVNGTPLGARDGLAISGEDRITLEAGAAAEIVLVELGQ